MFYESLEKDLLTQHKCIIMGDFNLPNIDWTLGRPTPAPGNKLLLLVADNNLTQHVHEPTETEQCTRPGNDDRRRDCVECENRRQNR